MGLFLHENAFVRKETNGDDYRIPYSGWFTYPIIEGSVERINGFPVFALGGTLFAIHSRLENVTTFPYAQFVPLMHPAIQSLEVFTTTTIVDLPLSLEAARSVLCQPIVTPEEIQETRANTDLSQLEVSNLRLSIQHLTSLLFAELPQADVYYITQKRAYKMSVFVKDADKVLSPDVIPFIEDTTLTDIKEAGRSLAWISTRHLGFIQRAPWKQ